MFGDGGKGGRTCWGEGAACGWATAIRAQWCFAHGWAGGLEWRLGTAKTVCGGSGGWMMILTNFLSVVLLTVMFSLMFKYVPDAKLRWRDVWIGGLISSVLFVIGKFGLGLYLGRGSYESSYGAAIGSFDQIEDLIAARAGTQVCAANAEAA